MAERTLEITTCMYGGNSRIAFIAGVGFALAELVIASRRHHGEGDAPGFDWLPDTADLPLPRVRLEVIAGASAGGVAGGVLGKMLFHSSDPEDDFARAAELFVDRMDVDLFARDLPCPSAFFDKTPLTTGGFRAMLDQNLPAPDRPALEPDGELWLALTHLSGTLEYFGQDDGGDAPVEDVNYLTGRRYDAIDYAALRDDLAEAVEATSANPFGFSAQFICDHSTVGGFACWLEERARHDPTVPQIEHPALPAERSAFFDGGALDNRPLGMAIDAMFRRGSGVDADGTAAVLLVDPDAQTAASTFDAILDGAVDGRREPHLTDQLAGLARSYKILRHERINDDLQRLVAWQERTRLYARLGPSTDTPAPAALATAADLIVFAGAWQRRARGESTVEPDLVRLAHALASTPHAHPARQAILLGGQRVRQLLAMQERWRVMARRARPEAADRLTIVDRLLDAELGAMRLQAEVLGDATPAQLGHLIREASAGAPLPVGAPVDLALRRVGPPPGGLASSDLGGTIGFFDFDLRAHDLLVGMALGRQAVARLLPPAAEARWRDHFGLDADPRQCECAVSWFATATGRLPWARWEAARARVAARRSDAAPSSMSTLAPSTRRYYPKLLDTAAHVLERLWVLSALARDRRDNTLYGLNRGPLAVLTRLLIPRLLRLDANVARRTENAHPIRRLSVGLLLLPLLFFVAVGTLSGVVMNVGWQKALLSGLASLVIGGAPLGIIWGIYAIKARRLRAACALPARSAADPPAGPRSGERSP